MWPDLATVVKYYKSLVNFWSGLFSICQNYVTTLAIFMQLAVWPDWAIYWTLGNFSKSLATINKPKSPTFLGNFCKGVKIINFSSGNHFWATFIDIWQIFTGHTDYLPVGFALVCLCLYMSYSSIDPIKPWTIFSHLCIIIMMASTAMIAQQQQQQQ